MYLLFGAELYLKYYPGIMVSLRADQTMQPYTHTQSATPLRCIVQLATANNSGPLYCMCVHC